MITKSFIQTSIVDDFDKTVKDIKNTEFKEKVNLEKMF